MAHYRAAWAEEHRILLEKSFWSNANRNCMDHCVLEWCKLFADSKDKHCWRNVVSNPKDFNDSLLEQLGVTSSEFEDEIRTMRCYRDKFVAHLDSERTMNIPALELAYKSVAFYHAQLVSEAAAADLQGLQLDFERGYQEEMDEASSVYRSAIREEHKSFV